MCKRFAAIFIVPAAILLLASFKPVDGRKVPAADVKTTDGQTFNTVNIQNEGKPIIISFWATWCKPCKNELNAIAEEYDELVKETGVKLIAISIDDARSSAKAISDAKTLGWNYDVYLDDNQSFKRAMNVNNIPHTFLVDNKGDIVWEHNSYSPGDEEKLFELVRKVAKGENVTSH